MANLSDSEHKSDVSIPLEDLHPYLTRDHGGPDPVKLQRKKDKILFKKPMEVIPEKQIIISAKITPSVGTRIDLQHTSYPKDEKRQPAPKYVVPKTKKQKRLMEQNRPYTYKKFCKYGTTTMAEPIPSQKVNAKFDLPSPETSKAKVTPRRVTPTSSWLYPDSQTSDELKLKKPKSGIIINPKEKEKQIYDYDSFDLVYKRKPRPSTEILHKKRSQIKTKGDGTPSQRKKESKKKKKKASEKSKKDEDLSPEEKFLKVLEKEIENDILLGQYGEGDTGPRDYLTKQFRRKVSMISHSTSYQSKDYQPKRELSTTLLANNKYAQKFRRESEIKRYQPKKRKFRRGTLESHSFTNVYQPLLKEFYFGCRQGTMHQGDEHLPQDAKKMQGICIPAAAYCYSFIKHPDRWLAEHIDEILDVGSKLYLSSLGHIHVHRYGKDLMPEDLDKYCIIGEKKVRFAVEDPEFSGLIKSTDKTVFNVTKALNIFFARQKAGILQTQDTNILIWKDKHFYFFDGKPRTKDLYYSESGTALMANFYDITAIVTVLLQRSGLQNWPFVIYPIKVYKVMGKDEDDDDEVKDLENNARSNYDMLNENKAVLLGSYDLGDKCFGFTRSKQSLPMVVVCLVYSRVTPPSAWHRQTVDKIMIIGNQLYIECMKCESIAELDLNTIPAFFTIGPYIVEIYIYSNRVVDMLYEKCNCQLKCCLEDFFKTNTNAIIQFGSVYLAVWKQRKMLYCFDPYSRGADGYSCRDGYACVSMHTNMESLIDLITHNFDNKDTVFKIHALKVCKIHRDPAQLAHFPKHIPLEEFPVDEFRSFKMKKSKKSATEKPVTVDYTALAMKNLLVGESPEPSIFEIGSTVESLCMEQIPPMLRPDRIPPKDISLLKSKPVNRDVIADLDSPSLSDTQIAPPRITQPKEEELTQFMDLDSFDLTQMEIELEEMFAEEGKDVPGEGEGKVETLKAKIKKEIERQAEVGEEDYYYTEDEYAQVRSGSLLPLSISEEINTELTYFPIKKEILYPTYVRGKQRMKSRIKSFRKDDFWDESYVPTAPDVTKSEELRKETNFVDLPDDTQIIRGTKNVAALGEDTDFIAPFVCVMANVVSKKYSILSWNSDIVDYVLKCGGELYNASKFRYDQVSKLEIPQISLGRMKFTCFVEYVFDSYTRQNILELAIDKILFVRSDMGVLVTPTYACALMYKNHLYYMYDGFGNNEVGLSEGQSNLGSACFLRFKDVHSLATRIMYNKQKRENNEEVVYTRFVLSSVKVKRIQQQRRLDSSTTRRRDEIEDEEMGGEDGAMDLEESEEVQASRAQSKQQPEPENKVGYHRKNGLYVIEGTRAIDCENDPNEEQQRMGTAALNQDHFSCLCACLMLLSCPVEKWDTKKVDEILDHGAHVYSHADDVDISEKRTIKNILIQKNFFDIIVKKIKIENWKNNKNLSQGIDTLIRKKLSYFLVQFPDKCFVVHKSSHDKMFHIFYACGLPKGKKNKNNKDGEEDDEEDENEKRNVAGWLRCKNVKEAKKCLKRAVRKGVESYDFYTFEVTSIRKAPKEMLINYRLNQYELAKKRKSEHFGKPFFEDIEWLKTDPIPWSRIVNKTVTGEKRGDIGNMWHNWDIEIDKDLYSLTGNIHQDCERFPQESRGKQTLCNLITCTGMLMIYDFTEWNAAVIDSILVNGDQYFRECVKDIKDEDYELSLDDLKESCDIFPFTFKVYFKPVVEGTMFLVRSTQFNLYKALRFFFENCDKRSGIICCTKSNNNKKQVAFGKTNRREYYMFEADAHGEPMFLEGMEKAYILRATSLNRLLHVLTMVLRGGDFYIYEVTVLDLKPIS